jgi:hypothetical protein
MEALATVALLQMTTAPRFPSAKAVDQYYQAHDPGDPSVVLFGSLAAIIAIIFVVAFLAPLPV